MKHVYDKLLLFKMSTVVDKKKLTYGWY